MDFNTKDIYRLELIAADFLDSRMIQDTINALQCLINIDPSNIKYKLYCAQLLFILHEYNVAEGVLLEAYKIKRRDVKVLRLLALCYWYQKKIKDFIKVSKKTRKLLPQNNFILILTVMLTLLYAGVQKPCPQTFAYLRACIYLNMHIYLGRVR